MNSDYIFGDDGFRGVYGEEYLSKGFLQCFGKALSIFLTNHGIKRLNLAHDSRASAHEIINYVINEINGGIEVVYFGCYSTPALASSTIDNCSVGLMITASHFPAEYNGVKLFKAGYKLKEVEERELEVLIRGQLLDCGKFSDQKKSLRKAKRDEKESYINTLLSAYLRGQPAPRALLEIDCANGAASKIAKTLSKKVDVNLCGNMPNGININKGSGAIDSPLMFGGFPSADYSILLDGDADRLALISRKFGPIDSELLVAIYLHRHVPSGERVVSSEVVNTGFINFCKNHKYELFITPAGDRNVVDKCKEVDGCIGFEPSGHFLIPSLSTSMDGLLSGLVFAGDFIRRELSADELKIYSKADRIVKNYKLRNKNDNILDWIPALNNSLFKISSDAERIFARKSIWEDVIRIYYDGAHYEQRSHQIVDVLKQYNKVNV